MKDSWPAPMATSEMPWGESRDSILLFFVSRKVAGITGLLDCCFSRLLLSRPSRSWPVKSASVIGPRSPSLISCTETKIAREDDPESQGEGRGSKWAKGRQVPWHRCTGWQKKREDKMEDEKREG